MEDGELKMATLGGMINNTIERADDFCRTAAK